MHRNSGPRHREQAIETDATSDRFSMLGSMVLWIFWPSFCSAIVPLREIPQTAINTVLALAGATLSTRVTGTRRLAYEDLEEFGE
jgi:ammonium transporter Rh